MHISGQGNWHSHGIRSPAHHLNPPRRTDMPSFYALITTIDGPPGQQPPYPSQGPGFPTNPIAGPGRPPWWGMAQDPGYGIPVGPGGPVDPGYSPPWARPPVDPGYSPPWARPQPPYPDNTLPGQQPHPSHPIYFPPEGGQPPLGIWGPTDPRPSNPISGIPGLPGSPGQQPHPEHPIVLPPGLPPTIPGEGGGPE